jgi:DNA-directed RNA polymerase subunit M/transcription elongation factor TFIIS
MPPQKLVTAVLLSAKGETRKINLALNADKQLSLETIQKYLRKKSPPENVAKYEFEDYALYVFGYKEGKKGTDNKMMFPPPYETQLIFGDGIAIGSSIDEDTWEKPTNLSLEVWTEFIENYFGKTDEDDENDNKDNEENEENDENESEDDENELENDLEDDIKSEEDVDESDNEDDYDNLEDIEMYDDIEDEPPVQKRKKIITQPICSKSDIHMLKDELNPDEDYTTNSKRKGYYNILQFLKEYGFTDEELVELERQTLLTAIENAKKQIVPRNWKSTNFCELHKQICWSVISNLHPNSNVKNPRLLQRVQDKEFPISDIPKMSSYELYPENWKELSDKQLIREQKILEGNKSRATDQFKCKKCGKRECTYYEMQTRSADEPMTIFITCLNCGKHWRQ